MEKYASKQKIGSDKHLKKIVKQIVHDSVRSQQELKSFDVGLGTTVDTSGSISKLTSIAQGDTDSTRDGDALAIVRIQSVMIAAVADTTNICRVVIFAWNSDDGVEAPTMSSLFQTTSTAYISAFNRDNVRSKKLVVLYDTIMTLSSAGPMIKESRFEKKWKKHQISFTATTTAGIGHIYAVYVSDSAGIPNPLFTAYHRVWFTDS